MGKFAVGTWKQAKRAVAVVTGATLLVAGLALLFLPGPGIVVLALALAILGTEFVWARRLLRRVRREAKSIGGRVLGTDDGGSDAGGDSAGEGEPPPVRRGDS